MGGKSKKTVIGYWYKWLAHFLFSQRVDAVLELRAGGKTMWAGRVTENQRISVNKPDLFGGIKNAGGQGGVVTDIDLQFGRDDQGPNDYLGLLGPKQTGHRRKFGIVIRGGKFGAFNSQPQTVAAKVERIVTDWQGDECWYPEKAIIPMSADTVVQASNAVWDYQISAAEAHPGDVTAADIPEGGWSSGEGPFAGGTLESTGNTNWPINTVLWCRRIISIPGSVGQVLRVRAENGCVVFVNGTFVGAVNQANDDIDGNQDNQFTFPLSAGQSYELAVKAFDEHNPSANSGTQLIIEVVTGGLNAMNPAHILHDNIVHRFNMGEPVGAINDASFRAAADRFFSEGFGLCTVRDPDQETPKQFENRICALVGAQVNQSRTDGLYYLDVIRSVTDAELVDLPVISSDDILEFDQQPNVIAEADNVFIGKWRDPQTKSDRATRPLVSQAALRASGVRSEVVKEYYEIPTEELVLRVIERDMNMATLPRSQFKLKCNRRVRGLRPGQPFRLQVPEEGIADMVCNLAKITHGTSTKGAVSIEALQNVFALSAASYIETDPPDWQAPDNSPLPSAAQAAIEAPYVELVALLPASDLADLPQDAGYVAALAARTPAGLGYLVATAASGEDYAIATAPSEWSPTALVSGAATQAATGLVITTGQDLDAVQVGDLALWDAELCRVDAIDAVAGTVTLGRGCADTVPATHADGSRLWLVGDRAGADRRQFVGGDVVRAKLLTQTVSGGQNVYTGPTLQVTMSDRASRPYPPGKVLIGDAAYPASVDGSFVVTWAHRNRVSQADQLIDTMAASIDPAPNTRYGLRFIDGTGAELAARTDIGPATATVALNYTGQVTMELYTIDDVAESLQRHEIVFDYTPPAGISDSSIDATAYTPVFDGIIVDGGA